MILGPLRILAAFNSVILRIGRNIAWVALALMVFVILIQVFFRYVLNNALPWPDEAARFLMLWMTGLVAASAYRWGGFVAIDMIPEALPKRIGQILMLILLVLSLVVLLVAVSFGWDHTFGFGGTFNSSSLRVPLDWFGGEMVRVKLKYMFASLLLGVILLVFVNVELILRNLMAMIDEDAELPSVDQPAHLVTEAE